MRKPDTIETRVQAYIDGLNVCENRREWDDYMIPFTHLLSKYMQEDRKNGLEYLRKYQVLKDWKDVNKYGCRPHNLDPDPLFIGRLHEIRKGW